MSANMGKRINADMGLGVDGGFFESPGLPVLRYCPVCGIKKHSGQSHPKCSRIMQRRYREAQAI